MTTLPQINGSRLWAAHMALAEVGRIPGDGVCRLAASEEDKAGRDLFARWCADAGLSVRVDKIGNMFARRAGRDGSRAPVLIGSHLDSQPTGGRFDGAFGILSGLEIVRTLNDAGIETEAPIEIVNWTNEEGCRFQPSSLGAEVAAGHIPLEAGLAAEDEHGISLGQALDRIGYRGDAEIALTASAYLEGHIEQGPILEEQGDAVGIVQGAVGVNGYTVTLIGREAHTGTTPVARRKDALYGAARCITEVRALALEFEPDGRATVARILVEPNARSVVASKAVFTADCRHRSPAELDVMTRRLKRIVEEVAAECGLDYTMTPYWTVPPRTFAPQCVEALEAAASALGLRQRRMVSGAGHDAIPLSAVVPTAMVFVPSKDGISHHVSEYTAPEHLEAGCNVLFRAAVALAGPAAGR
ncbi:M20 family metallo-hydrolase [Pseudochelatococcus sp. B33]